MKNHFCTLSRRFARRIPGQFTDVFMLTKRGVQKLMKNHFCTLPILFEFVFPLGILGTGGLDDCEIAAHVFNREIADQISFEIERRLHKVEAVACLPGRLVG